MTSKGNSALLPTNDDRRPPFQRGLMNFQLYNKSLEDWFLGKQLILFPSNFHDSRETKLTVSPGTSYYSVYYVDNNSIKNTLFILLGGRVFRDD